MKTEFEFNEVFEKSDILIGIYAITSKYDGKHYVGQTNDTYGFIGRFTTHRTALRANKHRNIMLQRSYNKRGEEAFKFEILEICEKGDDLNEKEIYWINRLQSMIYDNGWNIKDESDPDNYVKCYSAVGPDEKIYKIKSIRKFAIINHLDPSHLWELLHGIRITYNGWKSLHPASKRGKIVYTLLSPKGVSVQFSNIKRFARENNLDSCTLGEVIRGTCGVCRGWINPVYKDKFWTSKRYGRFNMNQEIKLVSPDFKIFIFNNYLKFCEKYNLNSHMLIEVINDHKKRKSHKGYVKRENLKLYAIQNIKTGEVIYDNNYTSIAKKINVSQRCVQKSWESKDDKVFKKTYKAYRLPIILPEIREDF